ncbi:unnamed protein product, partial [Rotaria magnacalcarata]
MYKPILNQKPQYNSLTNSIAAADFNEDGFLDMVVTNYGSHNIGILLGKGDGTFQNQITYSTGIFSHPYFVLVNGFNGDMHKDIVVANYGSNSLELFFGIGNGFFTSQVPFAMDNCRPVLIAVGDFNNDSLLDIAAANYDTNNIGIFLGYGNGSFQNQTVYTTELGSRSHSIAVGDFNRNSRLDLAVVNSGKDSMAIFYGNGHGTFANQKRFQLKNNFEIRVLLRHYWKKGLSARAAAAEICEVEGEGTIGKTAAIKWFKRFEDGDLDFEDKPRSGRPSILDEEDLRAALEDEPSSNTRDSADKFGVAQRTVLNYLHKFDFVYKKSRQDPYELTEAQAIRRVE